MNHPADQHPVSNCLRAPAAIGLPAPAPWIDGAGEADDLGLKGNINIIVDSRWLIGAVTLVCTLVALVYALVATPVYEADLLIHVEEESPNASENILSQVSSLFETKQAAIAQMELLSSRMVVGHAVDNLRLTIDMHPKYFPVIGAWLAQRGDGLSKPGIFGRGGFVWGAESADVAQFEVPPAWQNREFVLTAVDEGSYCVSGGAQPLVFVGKVGVPMTWRAGNAQVALRVDRLDARPGAQFLLTRLSRLAAIEQIQSAMLITEQGNQSGIIEVKLLGDNAQRIKSVLGEIGQAYIRQNLARKSEEAEKALAFLGLQLPALKRQQELSEERYNQFRNKHGSIDLDAEVRMSLQQAAAARTRSRALQHKKAELLTRFGPDHQRVRAVERQGRQAQAEIAQAQRRIEALPAIEQDEARLMREIKIDTELYTALANSAHQLSLIAVDRISNVRMIDAPMAPERPIKPNRPVIVGLAMIIGMFVGVVLAFTRRALNGAIDDPRTIERLLGARVVYASIPSSKAERRLSRAAGRAHGRRMLLAQASPEDMAVESLGGFRTALLRTMPHFRNNIVMISGPTRGVGKTFVTANLAAVLAASGMRVLLIDADLRHGALHRCFGVSRAPGLTTVISAGMRPHDAIHAQVLPKLDFIATGALAPSRSELLLQRNLGTLLDAVSGDYDVVLLDPPPILAVADALILGVHAGAVFILARADRSSEQDLKDAVQRLNHAGITPRGVLLNDLSPQLLAVPRRTGDEQDPVAGLWQ